MTHSVTEGGKMLTRFETTTRERLPAVWQDKDGVLHYAYGADVHPGVRLMWAACGSADVPADGAWIKRPGDKVTCQQCSTKEQG